MIHQRQFDNAAEQMPSFHVVWSISYLLIKWILNLRGRGGLICCFCFSGWIGPKPLNFQSMHWSVKQGNLLQLWELMFSSAVSMYLHCNWGLIFASILYQWILSFLWLALKRTLKRHYWREKSHLLDLKGGLQDSDKIPNLGFIQL